MSDGPEGKIAYLLLCHKDPEAVIAQARLLISCGDYVAIHFDGRGAKAAYQRLRAALGDEPKVAFAQRRIKCGWGMWSLVAASLEAMKTAVQSFGDAAFFYLVSGECSPIKSAAYMRAQLLRENADFIETHDFYTSSFIKTGFREERLHYRHYFDERKYKRLFYASYEVQKRLNLSRRPPADLPMRIGSQWWCLRRQTVQSILAFCAERKDVLAFFKTTWIPDETFFQTLVAYLVPQDQIRPHGLTHFVFSDYGLPLVFHLDHYEALRAQPQFFARKIAPTAQELRRKLAEDFVSGQSEAPIGAPMQAQYESQRLLGRQGLRFGMRPWESRETGEIYILYGRDWAAGLEAAQGLAAGLGCRGYGYLFNSDEAALPPMGGYERKASLRWLHRQAFIKLLWRLGEGRPLLFCLDPTSTLVAEDLARSGWKITLLDASFAENESFLLGHAVRMGLLSAGASAQMREEVFGAFKRETENARTLLKGTANIAYHALPCDPEEKIAALMKFANVDADSAPLGLMPLRA